MSAVEDPAAGADPIPPTIAWHRGAVRLVDQTALPGRVHFVTCRTVSELRAAVRGLVVRGAPALGVTGAFGVALAAWQDPSPRHVRAGARRIADARPTAANLAWGVDQALAAYESARARVLSGAPSATAVGGGFAMGDGGGFATGDGGGLATGDGRLGATGVSRVRGGAGVGIQAGSKDVFGATGTSGTPGGVGVNRGVASPGRVAGPTRRPRSLNATALRRSADAAGTDAALAVAHRIAVDDVARNRAMGRHGLVLVPPGARVATHCNTGSLACAGWGTALGVVRTAHQEGRAPSVWVGETRPVLQGARLTAWECQRLGIPATVVVDGAMASLMAAGDVDLVIVGADRIAANGDVANKVGTYALAVVARAHGVPFYVAAPTSTVDLEMAAGEQIVLEERSAEEVTTIGRQRIAPVGAAVRNPAFDVTPARLVTAFVTETGVVRPPYRRTLPAAVRRTTEF